MLPTKSHLFYLRLSGALFALVLLAACKAPMTGPAAPQPETTVTPPAPAATGAAPTTAPEGDPEGQAGGEAGVTVDVSGVAERFTSQLVAAVPASAGGPNWEAMPQYELLTLAGYPVTNHILKPQIYIYPAAELAAANPAAGQAAADLQALLQNQPAGENMPFLPLFNAAQVMHAQVKYLDFKNGAGVRYLTQFDQAPLPINNHELIYTYQGLSADGQYYVAAVLPANLASLPASERVTEQELPEFVRDFPNYLNGVVSALNQQPESDFIPALNRLDALIQSIEIQ